ncbi:MAG TPA: hypothetical protein VFK57_03325 [Vicinamibacterales bacterium]|nr:hypothetical protein [Vicinamibacterales bacterium]
MRRYLSAFAGSAGLHAGVIGLIVWLLSPGGAPLPDDTRPPDTAIAAFVVPPEDPKYPGLNPVDPAAGEAMRTLVAEDRLVSLDGFTFDAGKIASRALVLFPFVSPGIALEHFGVHRSGATVYRRPRLGPRDGGAEAALHPLSLSEAALQALIDRTWSRRERWTAFEPIRTLAWASDPGEGQLPALLQRYIDQNALQPYRDKAVPDPRLWAQLGIAADHVSFIGFIREYVAEYPSTRAAIELLFLLDRIAEASQDALGALLDTDPVRDLRWTRQTNARAFQLVARLRWHYQTELSKRGLSSPIAVARFYDRVRLAILDGIVRTSPGRYRTSDARVLIGSILWRQGRRSEAIEAWRGLSCAASDSYAAACTALSQAIPAAGPVRDGPALQQQITRVLSAEQGRWWDLSYDRLRKFGYRFDTY